MIAQLILNKYAKVVIPKNKTYYNPATNKWCVTAKWKKEQVKYLYSSEKYSSKLCLWIPPIDCLPVEFEGTPEQNENWINETAANCDKIDIQYCICKHENCKSPYLWIFNIDGLTSHYQKKELAKLIIPKNSVIDWTNLGQTLVPIIEHDHWKHNTIHKIVRGINPLEQKNKLPAQIGSEPNQDFFYICDSNMYKLHYKISDSVLEKIKKNKTATRLIAGDTLSYNSPSEARMALLFILVRIGLTDAEILRTMENSIGLNYQVKSHLHNYELQKVRSVTGVFN